ncbi:unnamed protein product, partial [Didymodactylos carnosus]
VMQLSQSPVLSSSTMPAIHKDNWQQRRYNFLSKNKMFGAELKDELVGQIINEQGSDIEHRPMVSPSQLPLSGSMDSEASNAKRESIIGMAVSGVRNLLVQEDDDDPDRNEMGVSASAVGLQSIEEVPKSSENDEVDHGQSRCSTCTQTENELLQTITTTKCDSLPYTVIIPSKSYNNRFEFILKRRPFRYFSSRYKNDRKQKKVIIQELYSSHRPYFTYWVTFVQALVCAISLIVYGYAPLTSNQSNNSSLTEQQKFDLTVNPWFGPHPADLIRLGAKYPPCMRSHRDVKNKYYKQERLEALSGCCIDGKSNQCMQTLEDQCLARSNLKWYKAPVVTKNDTKWNNKRILYPAVCGLTPEVCTKQLTTNVARPEENSWPSTSTDTRSLKWSPHATQWPICLHIERDRISHNISKYPYMTCKNIANPCCVGILGDCVLTSRDDCRRRRGIYHPRAHLCSQVDCIQSTCGMLEFFISKNNCFTIRTPDQVYRFWTVIFIHAGLIHLAITIIFQYTIMRHLEKLAGCIRVMIIYVVAGFAGSLASALFLRDSIQVGPGGGQMAILACYLSELFIGWKDLKHPWIPFFKIVICLLLLFTVGLLPLVDNYSQGFGFLFGFLLNMIVFPDFNLPKNVRRLVVICVSLAITIASFITLIVLFYALPFTCKSCKYLSCPFWSVCGGEKRDLV